MGKVSENLFALKPVKFRYKKEIDATNASQLGLVAEDVEKIDPALVVRDEEGKAYSVRYDQVNAMLLNEFLKEHQIVEKQQATIGQLRSTLASLRDNFEVTARKQEKEIEALAVGIQKVNAQVAEREFGTQVVASDEPTRASRNDK